VRKWDFRASDQKKQMLIDSDPYARFWNWKVFDRLIGLQGTGGRVPPGRPAMANDPRARVATGVDCLTHKTSSGGVAINPSDMVAFLVNEEYRTQVTFFPYRHVCGNHIVWDASNVSRVSASDCWSSCCGSNNSQRTPRLRKPSQAR
jgi:hypothetical protein